MTNPYNEDDFAKASENLRMAIGFLSRHKLPPSPFNYRLSYDYVAGKSQKLRDELDVLTSNGGFDPDSLWDVYRQHFIQDESHLKVMRQQLRSIIESVQTELQGSGDNLDNYSDTLSRFAEILDSDASPATLTGEVQKVLSDTKTIGASQKRLEENMCQVMAEVDELRKELEKVKEEALTDSLTGIANRKAFDRAFTEAMEHCRQENTPLTVVIGDIDHFKQFNDTYGHLIGDKVLKFVASTLKQCLKGADLAARFGGEEFAIILPNTNVNGATAVCEKIRKTICAKNLKDTATDKSYGKITMSIGLAQVRPNETAHDAIDRADSALYKAKQSGRNQVNAAPL